MKLLALNKTHKVTIEDIFIKAMELNNMVRVMNEQLCKLDVDGDYTDNIIKVSLNITGDF